MFAMEASTYGIIVAHNIVKGYVWLLWMPQLVVAQDIVIIYVVVMLYVPDLLWRQQSKLLINCVI